MGKRIGIMGGTFNPIHNGHLLMAEYAYNEYDLSEIMFIPNGRPEYKSETSIASNQCRFQMVEKAIEEVEYFSVSDMEINRPGNTYTIDTMKILMKENPQNEYYFIIGADSLYSLEQWNQAKKLMEMVKFLVAVRDEATHEDIESKIVELQEKYGARIEQLQMPAIGISSSMIRSRILKGKSVRFMLPEKVLEYIQIRKLYKKG